MKRKTAYKGRMLPDPTSLFSITSTILSGISTTPKLALSISLLVSTAFHCSCQKEAPDTVAETSGKGYECLSIECKSDNHDMLSASILTFRADSLGRLESYQYIKDIKDGKIWVACTDGPKTCYIYGNLMLSKEDIARISTASDLDKFHCNLEDVSSDAPFMTGMVEILDNRESAVVAYMKPMVSEITLNSISCNFSGTPYDGEKIVDPQIYLINVNAQCSLNESSQQVQRLINVGACSQDDVEQFSDPGIIRRFIGQDIGHQKIYPGLSLYCFHNFCKEEGPGSPFTRLVLEGKIQNETYYWPITINRTDEGEGIRNNTRHIFDLTIRRKGSLNPDEELSIEDCNIIIEWKEWNEKEEQSVIF